MTTTGASSRSTSKEGEPHTMLQESLIGGVLVAFGLIHLTSIKKENAKEIAIESAVMVFGGACVIGVAVCSGTGGAH